MVPLDLEITRAVISSNPKARARRMRCPMVDDAIQARREARKEAGIVVLWKDTESAR